MQDLRLIGVHEDGVHLLLADAAGTRYRVPLDDALRTAVRRDRPRSGRAQIEADGGLRPRDVQAMVRAGLSAAEVAERSGWTVEKVRKYQVPILAEREYVAGLARAVRLRHRTGGGSGPTLGSRVAERLDARGVSLDSVAWDSWRQEGTAWTVVVTFPAGGRQRQATWTFDPDARTVHARDDEARWLSEEELVATPAAAPADAPVYDVEADGGVDGADAAQRRTRHDPVDLVASVRARTEARSRRGGGRRRTPPTAPLPIEHGARVEQPSPDAKPTAGAKPTPDAKPAADAKPTADAKPAVSPEPAAGAAAVASPDATDTSDATDTPDATDASGTSDSAGASDSTVLDNAAAPDTSDSDTADPADDAGSRSSAGQAPPGAPRAKPTRRPGRTPVPQWDDIVFGAKGEDGA